MTRSKGVGRGRKGIPRAPYSIIDGKKLCRGALHPPGGEWLPATEEYFYPRIGGLSKQFLARCRQCRAHHLAKKKRSAYGYASVGRVWFVFEELERRVGRAEAARRTGVGSWRWRAIVSKEQQWVEKETFRRVALVLREARAKNEVRHKDDIKFGSAARGLPEKEVRDKKDLYRPTGDNDLEIKRRSAARSTSKAQKLS